MSLFSRKKKLIVSGCSYTDDYASTQDLDTFPLWSNLLAEKLYILMNKSDYGLENDKK